MEELFGVSMNIIMGVLLVIFLVAMAIIGVMASRNRIMLKLGLRNILRRRAQTVLIIIGIMLSSVITAAAFGTAAAASRSAAAADATLRRAAPGGGGEVRELVWRRS